MIIIFYNNISLATINKIKIQDKIFSKITLNKNHKTIKLILMTTNKNK
jgi:hypothetical protein